MNICLPVAEHAAAGVVEDVDEVADVVEVLPEDGSMLTGDVMADMGAVVSAEISLEDWL